MINLFRGDADVLASAYHLLGKTFIGGTDSLNQEPDFYGPVSGRYMQRGTTDASNQSIMRIQKFGEEFRRLLYMKVAQVGGVLTIAVVVVCLMLGAGINSSKQKWAEMRAASARMEQEAAANEKSVHEAMIVAAAKHRWSLRVAKDGLTEQCTAMVKQADEAGTDPEKDDTYRTTCLDTGARP